MSDFTDRQIKSGYIPLIELLALIADSHYNQSQSGL